MTGFSLLIVYSMTCSTSFCRKMDRNAYSQYHVPCLLSAESSDLRAAELQPTKCEAWRDIPEVKEMRKKTFRKYLRNLKTEEEKEAAKAKRAEQTAHKHQLISDFLSSQKKKRKAGNAPNVIKQVAEGMLHIYTHC